VSWLSLSFLALAVLAGLAAAAWLLWRRADGDSRLLLKRIARLRWRAKARLALRLLRDGRVPLGLRLLPPLLVLYLALPLDFVPDFIPVLGQLDDLLIVGGGLVLILRFTPLALLEEHLRDIGE
jgi:uncharacterized membrane protein YkvA (DUF1232 family)